VTFIWVVLHSLGLVLWIGGSLAALAAVGTTGRLDPGGLLGAVRAIAPVYRWLVGPGLMLTTASGLFLALGMYRIEGAAEGGLSGSGTAVLVMILAGLAAALVGIVSVLPDAGRLNRLDPLQDDGRVTRALLAKLARSTWISSGLALVAWVGGMLGR
jgi:hypothetical protein